MRRRSSNKFPVIIIVCIVLLFVILMINLLTGIGEREPKDVVKAFYHNEQEGDFGSSWELFHPVMQKRFSKNGYVTERSHLYMSHYGVDTFSFELGDKEKVKNWKMSKDTKKFPEAHRFEVKQTFKSKFGTFTVVQDTYVVKDEKEWKIVWDYN